VENGLYLTDWLWLVVPACLQALGWYFWGRSSNSAPIQKSRTVAFVLGAISLCLSDIALIVFIVLSAHDNYGRYFYRFDTYLFGLGCLFGVVSLFALLFGNGWSRFCFIAATLAVLSFWWVVAFSV
jgi:hypothetical protein